MSNILRYSNSMLVDVRSVLWNIKERGGSVSSKFLVAEVERLRNEPIGLFGHRSIDVVNIALAAMGCTQPFPDQGTATDREMDVLVLRAQKQESFLLSEIAALRAAKKG